MVTTVLDLMLAQYGVARDGLPGELAGRLRRRKPTRRLAGADHRRRPEAVRACRSRVRAQCRADRGPLDDRDGRTGTNHLNHSDTIYRTFLALVLLVPAARNERRRLGHYVGQEKVRPLSGWHVVRLRLRLDAARPRHQSGRRRFYLATDHGATRALGRGARLGGRARTSQGEHVADLNALGARLGWLPMHPAFDRNPLDLVDDAEGGHRAGRLRRLPRAAGWPARLRLRGSRRAGELAAHPHRLGANILGSSARSTSIPQAPARLTEAGGACRRGPGRRPPDGRRLARRGATGRARSPDDDRLRMTSMRWTLLGMRAAGGLLYERSISPRPTCTRSCSTFNAHPAAVEGEDRLGRLPTSQPSSRGSARGTSASAATSSRRRFCTTRRTKSRSPSARSRIGGPASASRCREDDAEAAVVDRDYPAVAAKHGALAHSSSSSDSRTRARR